MEGLAGVAVAVGGFLDVEVVPLGGIQVVGPLVHVGEQVGRGLGLALKDTVDEGHGFGAGDVLVGLEGAVGVALDPVVVVGDADLLGGPVADDVGEGGGLAGLGLVKAGGDGGELGTGDGLVGLEGAVGVAGDDAEGGHGGDGVVVPLAVGNVGVGVGCGEGAVADFVTQEAEEDGGDFGTGDLAVGMDGTVRIADDVGEVVGLVQHPGVLVDDGGDDDGIVVINTGVGVGKGELFFIIPPADFTAIGCDPRVVLCCIVLNIGIAALYFGDHDFVFVPFCQNRVLAEAEGLRFAGRQCYSTSVFFRPFRLGIYGNGIFLLRCVCSNLNIVQPDFDFGFEGLGCALAVAGFEGLGDILAEVKGNVVCVGVVVVFVFEGNRRLASRYSLSRCIARRHFYEAVSLYIQVAVDLNGQLVLSGVVNDITLDCAVRTNIARIFFNTIRIDSSFIECQRMIRGKVKCRCLSLVPL